MKKTTTSLVHLILCGLVILVAILSLAGFVPVAVNLLAAGMLIGAMGLENKFVNNNFRFIDVMFLIVGVLCLVAGIVNMLQGA